MMKMQFQYAHPHNNNLIQFNLFMRKLNSSKANYKASTSREEKTHTYKQIQK
jgi:hypothetical protein